MARGPTLDQLWHSLGLDSLPPDAGTAHELDGTRRRDWDDSTLRSGEHQAPLPEARTDLPSLSFAPPVEADQLKGELIVTGLLGEGGMGRVLLAHQRSLGRDVAVKVPRSSAPRTVHALIHEAEITGGLEHPGVIPVYALSTDGDGNPALVMKRVDGVSWSMLLRNADDPAWARIAEPGAERIEAHVEILRQVCNAIAFAHRKGVLHRDLKPSNVLIGEFGEVYVADWGIACPKPRPDSTRRPGLVGSPVYLAPEMVTGEDAQMDERTDVFLLGSTLYEVLTGAPPWAGPDLKAVLGVALECELRPFPPAAPPELVSICRKAMAPQRSERFQTALELREALTGFLRHRGSVRLSAAAQERLTTLLATLQSTDKENAWALMSECRFGFSQALREWPENQQARQGLRDCLVAMARHELGERNLVAARALLSELGDVPAELTEQLQALERTARADERERAHLAHLRQQMDPKVAMRQRIFAYVASASATAVVIVLPYLFPQLHAALQGKWYLTSIAGAVAIIVALGTFLGRRSLLSTRLNRRLIFLLMNVVFGTVLLRVACAELELSTRQTLLMNFLFCAGAVFSAAVSLESRLFLPWTAIGVGFVLAWLLPGAEPPIFSTTAFGAMLLTIATWRSWRNEFR